MGTNYYLPQTTGPDLHIGKRSAGWQFGFRAQPNARSRADWERLVADAGTVITEGDVMLTPDQFWDLVDATREPRSNGRPPLTRAGMRGQRRARIGASDYMDSDGWDFTDAEFT